MFPCDCCLRKKCGKIEHPSLVTMHVVRGSNSWELHPQVHEGVPSCGGVSIAMLGVAGSI